MKPSPAMKARGGGGAHLQHDDSGTFAHYKSVPLLIKGPRCLLWFVVELAGQSSHAAVAKRVHIRDQLLRLNPARWT